MLLIIASLFKIILKYIARKIDIVRMIMDRKNTDNVNVNANTCNHVSCELLVELVITLYYYWFYYTVFVLELSVINKIDDYVQITAIHLFSESMQSIICFSRLYFNQLKNLHLYIEAKNFNNICCSKLVTAIDTVLQDDSTFDEWRTRHSIDMTTRLIALIVTFINNLMLLFVIGYEGYGMKNVSQYYRTIYYYLLSFFIDIIYFTFVFLINYVPNSCISSQFSIFKPFLLIFASDHKIVVCLFVLSFGLLLGIMIA